MFRRTGAQCAGAACIVGRWLRRSAIERQESARPGRVL